MEVFDKPDIVCIPHSLFGCDALVLHHCSMVYQLNLIILTVSLVLDVRTAGVTLLSYHVLAY